MDRTTPLRRDLLLCALGRLVSDAMSMLTSYVADPNVMEGPTTISDGSLHTYLRDAFICLVPRPTENQLERVAAEMHRAHPDTLVRAVSEFTLLVQGIPVMADSDHNANALTWERTFIRASQALSASDDAETKVVSIDVCPANGLY